MASFPPHYCAVCGRSFSNQYFHTKRGGDVVAFADCDDSFARQGYVPGVVGVAWICEGHLAAARERVWLPTSAAISELQMQFGVCPKEPIHGRPNPELVLTAVGPNRSRVIAIVHQATGASPKAARDLLDHLPAQIAEGWPMSFETWRCQLCEAGASVEIRWD